MTEDKDISSVVILTDVSQAQELLEMFDGNDTEIALGFGKGYAGTGLYAWYFEYPDEGSVLLGEPYEEVATDE